MLIFLGAHLKISVYECSFRIYIIFYHRTPFNKTTATLVRPHPFFTLCPTPLGKSPVWKPFNVKEHFAVMTLPTGRPLDGVWHTAIVVYGKEYFYGGSGDSGSGIQWCTPGGTVMGQPLKVGQ